MDLPVKAAVRAAHGRRVVHKRPVGPNHALQHKDFLVAGMARGQTGGQRLKLGADGVKLGQLVVIKRGNDQAAPIARQHGLRLKPLQGLAHRGARHPEPLGQFGFDQSVAGAIHPAVDRLEDQVIGITGHIAGHVAP